MYENCLSLLFRGARRRLSRWLGWRRWGFGMVEQLNQALHPPLLVQVGPLGRIRVVYHCLERDLLGPYDYIKISSHG